MADAPSSDLDGDAHSVTDGVTSAGEKCHKEESSADEHHDNSSEQVVSSLTSVSSMNKYVTAKSMPMYGCKKYSPAIKTVLEERAGIGGYKLTPEQSRAIGLA